LPFSAVGGIATVSFNPDGTDPKVEVSYAME
jgi:hypothetical protein